MASVLASDHKEALGLPLPPPRRDRCRRLALPGQDQIQDRLPVARPRRLGILLAPGAPVDRRHDAGKAAEHVLGIRDRALLLVAPRGPQASVDVAADPAEHQPVAVGVAPAQIGFQGVARQIVREHTRGPRLHEGQPAQPGEQLVRVVEPEDLPQQRLGGHPGDRAHLQGAAMRLTGDDLDELSQQGSHQIRGQRVGCRLAAANDDVGQQRQPQRVAMRLLDQLVVTGRVDATRGQVRPTVLRAQIAQGHDPQQLPPGRIGAPAPDPVLPVRRSPPARWPADAAAVGCVPSHPAVPAAHRCRAEPPPGHRRTAPAMAPSPSGTVQHLAQRLEHGRRRRVEIATVKSNHDCTGVGREPSTNVQQPRLADAWWPVDVKHPKWRFGRVQRDLEQLHLRAAADESSLPARRQQVAERATRLRPSHTCRIGAPVHVIPSTRCRESAHISSTSLQPLRRLAV